MVRIAPLNFIDVFKLQQMISFLTKDKSFDLLISPIAFLQKVLPLQFKRLAQSYVAKDGDELLGLISIRPKKGNPYKWKIVQLFLAENAYDAGRLLIDFVTAKYGAIGVNTFFVKVDESHNELIDLFSTGCGYRICSSEQLFKLDEKVSFESTNELNFFRPFKNTDAKKVNELNTDCIVPHFKHSLSKHPNEFADPLLQLASQSLSYKFVLEDKSTNRLLGYFVIMSEDGHDFVVDMILANYCFDYISDVLNFCVREIEKRTKDFDLFFLNRNYLYSKEHFEDFLYKHKFSTVNNRMVLVKDFFKRVKEVEAEKKSAIIFSNISTKPAFNNHELSI